jgi:hypothetical protein
LDSPEELLEHGVDYLDKTLTLDLEFLFNMFLRDGADINLRVVRGIPEGARAIAGGISGGSLVIVFDSKVPDEIWFEDRNIPQGSLN